MGEIFGSFLTQSLNCGSLRLVCSLRRLRRHVLPLFKSSFVPCQHSYADFDIPEAVRWDCMDVLESTPEGHATQRTVSGMSKFNAKHSIAFVLLNVTLGVKRGCDDEFLESRFARSLPPPLYFPRPPVLPHRNVVTRSFTTSVQGLSAFQISWQMFPCGMRVIM